MRRIPATAMVLACLLLTGRGLVAQTPPDLVILDIDRQTLTALGAEGQSAADRAIAEALIARREGRAGEAIATLRALLRREPGTTGARRLLANLLAETGQYRAAEAQFLALLEDDPDTAARAAYLRALRRISALKPWGIGASLAIVPSSNINRGTASDIFPTEFGDFIISEDSRSTTGVGLSAAATAFRRFDLARGRRLQVDLVAGAIVYEAAEFNQHSYTLRATLSGRTWAVAPEYVRAYVGGALSYAGYGVSAARALPIGPGTSVRLRVAAEQRDYRTDTFLTGQRYEVAGTLRRRLGARTAVEGTLAYNRGDTASESFRYDGVEVGARVRRGFGNGLRLGVGAAHEWRPYRGDFTGVTFARNDNITTLDVDLLSDRWTVRGAAATTSCRLTFARSNVAFYDYDVAECTIGFTRAF